MTLTANNCIVARQRADWMTRTDEEILETLRDKGNLNPAAVEKFDVTVANYASNRLSKMSDYGLVERIAPGLYRLTEVGDDFLDEELDAAELESADESE